MSPLFTNSCATLAASLHAVLCVTHAVGLHAFWQTGANHLSISRLKHEKEVNLPGLNGLYGSIAQVVTCCHSKHSF